MVVLMPRELNQEVLYWFSSTTVAHCASFSYRFLLQTETGNGTLMCALLWSLMVWSNSILASEYGCSNVGQSIF